MAAELDYKKDGTANIFSVLETPWHQEGKVLTSAPTFEEALTLAEFDYTLEKRPHYLPLDPQDHTKGFTEAGDSHYIYRPDIKKNLGRVGDSYEIVSNRQAFEILKPLVDNGVLSLETGGVLRYGADAWLMGAWKLDKFGPKVQEVFNKDGGLLPYATVMANHNGRRAIQLGCTTIRIVCANTLGAAESEDSARWRYVNHKAGAGVRLVEAAKEVFDRVVSDFEIIAKQYDLMMKTTLSDELFKKMVLDVCAPDPRLNKKWNPEAKLANVVFERSEKKRKELTRLWTQGKGHIGNKSAWESYNGMVECIDFNKELFPNRGGSFRSASLLTGHLGNMKSEVLDNLYNYCLSA